MTLTLKRVSGVLALATTMAIGVGMTQSAQAITLTTSAGQFSTVSGATTFDFEGQMVGQTTNGFGDGTVTYTGNGRIEDTSVSGQYAAPYNDSTNYLTLGGTNEPGPVTLQFTKLMDYFGLYWGSVDRYNSIDFYNGATQVGHFTGLDALNPASGDQGVGGSVYANFLASGLGDSFDKIVMSSSQAAFETDNHAYRAIPTPALLPGLVALGFGMVRGRKGQRKQEAEA